MEVPKVATCGRKNQNPTSLQGFPAQNSAA